jgi:hypothetical protein
MMVKAEHIVDNLSTQLSQLCHGTSKLQTS